MGERNNNSMDNIVAGKGMWKKIDKEINVQKRHTNFIPVNYAFLLGWGVGH